MVNWSIEIFINILCANACVICVIVWSYHDSPNVLTLSLFHLKWVVFLRLTVRIAPQLHCKSFFNSILRARIHFYIRYKKVENQRKCYWHKCLVWRKNICQSNHIFHTTLCHTMQYNFYQQSRCFLCLDWVDKQ